uniref:Uncharacterized protein n=1 Tax=Neobodo designis TaxID=312471 RepID=A0A7S1LVR1_NEODS|mmetsp:Transcript_29391/g.90820  ORF Transcript_29391/g.90820 Transcript_29391/m.90820 type:complete len:104 (+) Transcript_29391:31-342(+)
MQRVRAACVVAVGVRHLKVRQENFFRNEAVSHARRGSWAPQTTAKKQGAFVRFARSNFYDKEDTPADLEPFCEEQVEAHRNGYTPDVYIYKYTVTPTHFSLRP